MSGLPPPVPFGDLPFGHRLYLLACTPTSDPTMVWGTEVLIEPLRAEVARRNRDAAFLVTPVHYYVKAVERAMADHPNVNRRILKGRIRPYEGHHLTLSTQTRAGQAGVVQLRNVEAMDVEAIGRAVWSGLLGERKRGRLADRLLRRRRFPVMRLLGPRIFGIMFRRGMRWADGREKDVPGLGHTVGTAVLVNHIGGVGMPPMRSFRPSRLPLGCLLTSVTIGPAEMRPVASDRGVEARWTIPLHVRSDHRLVDGVELGHFTAAIKGYIESPERLIG